MLPVPAIISSPLGIQNNEVSLDDDDFLDFNDFTSETASPRPLGQASQDEDVVMKIAASPNQAEGSEQAASVQENNSNLPDEASSGDQIQPTGNAGTTSLALSQDDALLAPPQENTSLTLLQANTSILTVDALKDIVKGGRSTSPIRERTSDLEFFNIKEQRYHQHMQKFRNGDGSYTVSHPIDMSLFLALETEQRNKNYIIAQNEYQMTHMRNIVDSANFAVRIRDEVSANNITKHIIDKHSSPVADSQKQIEKYTETLLQKLSDHEAQLDNQKNHRLDRGFLSRIREEHAAEVLGHRITVLKEDNEELRSERDDLEKANIGAQKMVARLKVEKASWQEKYLNLLEGNKRQEMRNLTPVMPKGVRTPSHSALHWRSHPTL
jgi:hypothetical protein